MKIKEKLKIYENHEIFDCLQSINTCIEITHNGLIIIIFILREDGNEIHENHDYSIFKNF